MPRLLIVEATEAVRGLIERRFDSDFAIKSVTNVDSALNEHSQNPYDLVVWDTVSVPSECSNTIHIIKKFLKNRANSRAIILSDVKKPDIINARNIPCEWLQKPVYDDRLLAVIENTIRPKAPDCNTAPSATELVVPVEFEGILAFNLKMRTVIQHIMEAAAEDIPVLIVGETGTGKDLVAAAIHKRSRRSNCPYLPVNMGAIAPELIASELFGHEKGAYTGASERRAGLFEQAQGGTLFLDEITTMDNTWTCA
jgi:DNA-binding NtrC family response regulator